MLNRARVRLVEAGIPRRRLEIIPLAVGLTQLTIDNPLEERLMHEPSLDWTSQTYLPSPVQTLLPLQIIKLLTFRPDRFKIK